MSGNGQIALCFERTEFESGILMGLDMVFFSQLTCCREGSLEGDVGRFSSMRNTGEAAKNVFRDSFT